MAKVGRPTKYDSSCPERAKVLCMLGGTDADLAALFGVSEQTVNTWKQTHPEFLESLKSGKLQADITVADSLYQRAIGSEWVEQQAFKVRRVTYENGKRLLEEERIEVVDVVRRAPPDTTAQIFWLKNRAPAQWRDKQDLDVRTPEGIQVENVTDAELRKQAHELTNRIAALGASKNGKNGNGAHP